MKQTTYHTVKDGRITVQGLSSLEGKKVEVCVKKLRKTRSNDQNRYYWGVCVEYFWRGLQDLGHEIGKAHVHDMLRLKFLKQHLIDESTGEIMEYVKSTTELSTSEFMDYVANIQRYAIETVNVLIPDPNQLMQEAAL